MIEKLKFLLGRIENIVRKGENAGFSFSHSVFYPFGELTTKHGEKTRKSWLPAFSHKDFKRLLIQGC